jgi:hypothetical protein
LFSGKDRVNPLDTKTLIQLSASYLAELKGHAFDVIKVEQPISTQAAINLSKIISKLSPIVGNLIEFNTVEFLNSKKGFTKFGKWERQDPGFPDTVFRGQIDPQPGFEIKAWFPFATEITARFKDSQNQFTKDNTHVAIIAWLPEHVIFGRPKILDVVTVSAASVAEARDRHYHNPPDYVVIEPGDTTTRSRNLQQTNTSGYKWQGNTKQLQAAKKHVQSWGDNGRAYVASSDYQRKVRELISLFPYRLDTNYAKLDRIAHKDIEEFKDHVMNMPFQGATVKTWAELICGGDIEALEVAIKNVLKIKPVSPSKIIGSK